MAMSRRTRGTNLSSSARHPRLPAAYEDFKPVIEREQDQSSHFILIYLPGFLKDQIRLVVENSSRIIRVHGERFVPATGNNRIRFRENIIAPEDCQLTVHANFEGGILRITLPKLIVPVVAEDHSAQSSPLKSHPYNSPPSSSSPIPLTEQPQLQPLDKLNITPEKHPISAPPNRLPAEEYVETSPQLPLEGKGEDKNRDHQMEGKELEKATTEKNDRLKLNEDRQQQQQLLVNVGVAAMVIFSLGAYISHTFGDWEI